MLSVLSAEPKAEAYNFYRDLDYSGCQKQIESNNCFIIHCFEINNDKRTVARNQFDIALGNHEWRAQPTD